MRMIKVTVAGLATPAGKVTIEVESILPDDLDEAKEEGRRAIAAVEAFQEGMTEQAESA